ncbi:MAG TPA: S53 family peptidase [Candidatus Baltobacteraceae bacterium]|nr:S53 family peptidase [Candidatus Baltobacteraceae bacterium]
MRLRFSVFLAAASVTLASCGGGGVSPQPARMVPQAKAAVNAPFNYSVHPRVQRIGDLLLHNCPGGTVCALTPAGMNTAYDYSYFPGRFDGTGQTIVIVVAFGSPTIQSDLATFDSKVIANLPPPPSFKIDYPGGSPTVNLNNAVQLGWAEETTLDVEWAHAAAPGANIVLVVSNNDQGSTVQNAQQYAVSTYQNSVVSLSFGLQEASINGGANNTQIAQAHQIYSAAALQYHDTVVASAGDQGSSGLGISYPNPQYPASDPYVLSVGGTSLTLASHNKYAGETAWNDGIGNAGATGGAPSTIFDQSLLPHQAAMMSSCDVSPAPGAGCRQVADVSFAGSDNAVEIYIGFTAPGVTPGLYAAGGTSVGAPMVAGLIAVANQQRAKLKTPKGGVGWITDAIYANYGAAQVSNSPPFHDITAAGDNVFVSGLSPQCCSVGIGYDNPTGLGTPDVNNLVSYLTSL